MTSLATGFKTALHHHAASPVVRQRIVEQALLLRQLNYLKGSFSLPERLMTDPKTFERFVTGLFSPSRLTRDLKGPVLHSFVLTLLIALGDDAKLRRKVGASLQKTEKHVKHLDRIFEKDAAFFGQYVSLLSPQSESASLKLLRLAG